MSSPRDRFARRSTALFAIFLTVISVSLFYPGKVGEGTYRWQKETYQGNPLERILVRLGFSRTKVENTNAYAPKGDVGVEVVNIGMRPIYIDSVQLEFDGRIFTFDERDPFQPKEGTKLGPGESANYKLNWDFTKEQLDEWVHSGTLERNLWADIETTKKTFHQHPVLSWFSISTAISSNPRAIRIQPKK